MTYTSTIIIGAGQCGLAMSAELSRAGVDHLVLERGPKAGHSWRTERWDSLRLLTPNSRNGLAGAPFAGRDHDGFMTVDAFVQQFDRAVAHLSPPLVTSTEVERVSPLAGGYLVDTDRGPIRCDSVVMATGACAIPKPPACAAEAPGHLQHLSPQSYKRPSDVAPGPVLVVGASASGQQIARELCAAGRDVTLAVGAHVRLPRRYRDTDITVWMEILGLFDTRYDQMDDIDRVRRTPSLTLAGGDPAETLDLNVLQEMGVEITGRLAAIRDGRALFSGSLPAVCKAADLKMARLLAQVERWLEGSGLSELISAPEAVAPTRVPDAPRLSADLPRFGSVVWATGFRPDFSWLDMDAFDRKGGLIHDGGVVAPGLFAMGLPAMRTRRSSHIDGALDDAAVLAADLMAGLGHARAA
ncbi:MAG: NAD(P)-binding domain-containing protein [Pseudomonadota bacterium]